MVNKMNHIPTLSLTGKCPKLHYPMLGIKIKLYSSKNLIQFNPEVKNNLHSLFLQESPAKDGLLLFKYLKLSYRGNRDTKPNSWLSTSSHALLFPCKRTLQNIFFGKIHSFAAKALTRGLAFSFLPLCYKEKSNIWK